MISKIAKALFAAKPGLEDELEKANERILELEDLLSDRDIRYASLRQEKMDDWRAACKSAQAASSAIMELQRQVFCMRGGNIKTRL
jgi:hypothetical protein